MQKDDIYATGTLRSNRKLFPTELLPYVKRGLPQRGDIKFCQNDDMVIFLWQDTRPVLVASTAHTPTSTSMVTRKRGNGSTISIPSPTAIVDYNNHMGGVDIGDQYRKYYQVRMKSRKAYKYIFWFLMEICSLNAFILHRHYLTSQQKKPPTYLEFRIQLAKQLIGDYNSRKRLGRPPSLAIPLPKRIPTEHFPQKSSRGRCRHCKNGFTVWF